MKTLKFKNQVVQIDAGELVSYQVAGHEIIHQKGDPGWQNADTEMFPIIGPTNEADFKLQTPKGYGVQDQHGLLREMEYIVGAVTDTSISYTKSYSANKRIPNSKYPEKSTEKELYWPYEFKFSKVFQLDENGLQITFIVAGVVGMPYMLGYHPAFKIHNQKATLTTAINKITISEIINVGNRAMEVAECSKIILSDKKDIEITTQGFGSFMLWTEVPTMVCIEPITFYPYAVDQKNLYNGFTLLENTPQKYSIQIRQL